MTLPLYGFLEGDTLGLLIVAEEGETIRELMGKLQAAAAVRVHPIEAAKLIYNRQVIDPDLTLAQAGFKALERFDVVRSAS